MNANRLKNLKLKLKNPLLIKKKENLSYLSGQSFEKRADEYLLLHPTAVKAMPVAFGGGLEKIDWIKKVDSLKNIGNYLVKNSELNIEYGFTYGEGKYLEVKLKDRHIKVKPARSAVDVMRQIKDADELLNIRKSMQIVEQVFILVRKEIKKPGITEIKLAQFIQSQGLKMGAEDISFPAIVASGANAAVPHHSPGNKKLKAGESIIIDFGFKYKGYCSDFTRTVFLKTVPKRLEIAYNQVEKAYNECMEFFQPDGKKITGDSIYQKAVKVLAAKQLDKYFIHSLGHGTGLEIHELPNLSPKSKDVLANNMVFSIEPGVYLPKIGGIRIEDLVYLENNICKKFINVPTKLISNIIL